MRGRQREGRRKGGRPLVPQERQAALRNPPRARDRSAPHRASSPNRTVGSKDSQIYCQREKGKCRPKLIRTGLAVCMPAHSPSGEATDLERERGSRSTRRASVLGYRKGWHGENERCRWVKKARGASLSSEGAGGQQELAVEERERSYKFHPSASPLVALYR